MKPQGLKRAPRGPQGASQVSAPPYIIVEDGAADLNCDLVEAIAWFQGWFHLVPSCPASANVYSVQSWLKFCLVPGLVPLGSELAYEFSPLPECTLSMSIWDVLEAWFRLGSAWF